MTFHSEQTVSLPVINPETGGTSRTFRFMGKADVVADRRLIDWKSTSNIAQFINERRIGFQPELYALALRAAGMEIDEIEFRLVTKPTILFCGKDKNDPHAYEERCLAWLLDKRDSMCSHVHQLTGSRMAQARQFLWDCSKRVLENRANDRWLPSAKSCYAWSRECEYLPLCEAVCDGSDLEFVKHGRYEVRTDPHDELKEETSKDILTHSSLSCLTLCEVKFYWRYELGLRRQQEQADSLWIGSAMHVGLDAYVTDGLDTALQAIDAWVDANPVLGPEAAHKQDEQQAKARAMVRAAAIKWIISPQHNPPLAGPGGWPIKQPAPASDPPVEAQVSAGREVDASPVLISGPDNTNTFVSYSETLPKQASTDAPGATEGQEATVRNSLIVGPQPTTGAEYVKAITSMVTHVGKETGDRALKHAGTTRLVWRNAPIETLQAVWEYLANAIEAEKHAEEVGL